MVDILLIESRGNDGILQEVMECLSTRTQCRVKNLSAYSDCLSFPGLDIYIKEQTVYHNSIPVPMTHHEFFTLLCLAQHPGWVFTKEQIYENVWKELPEHCEAVITNVISQIRRKIGKEYIKTVINSGYKFEV